MNNIRFAALLLVICGTDTYVGFGPIRKIFQEKPLCAIALATVGMIVYRVTMEE